MVKCGNLQNTSILKFGNLQKDTDSEIWQSTKTHRFCNLAIYENAFMAKRPATHRPATQKPASRKPATRRLATRRPATRRPATRRPATRSRQESVRRESVRRESSWLDKARLQATWLSVFASLRLHVRKIPSCMACRLWGRRGWRKRGFKPHGLKLYGVPSFGSLWLDKARLQATWLRLCVFTSS